MDNQSDNQNQSEAQSQTNSKPQPQINNAQVPVQNQPATKVSKKSYLKKLLIILLVVIMFLLSIFAVFGAYYLGKNMNKLPKITNSTPTTKDNASEESNLNMFSNKDLSFKYSKEYNLTDNMLKIKNSNIQIDIIESNTPIGGIDCAKTTSTKNVNNIFMLKYSYIKGVADCEKVDSDQRQIWLVKEADSMAPAIVISFSSADEIKANQIANQLIPTIIFNK